MLCITQGEKTAVIICKYLTIDIEPGDMKQVFIKKLLIIQIIINCGNIIVLKSINGYGRYSVLKAENMS